MTTDRTRLVVTDPERIRALAHPLRLRILNVLQDEGEATATRCAAVTGESVASCSFHLRMLAKYGYIEPAERRGREKPWRPIRSDIAAQVDPEQPGQGRAVAAAADVFLGEEYARLRGWLAEASRGNEDPAWLLAGTMTRATFWATRAELSEVSREIEAISARFAGRQADPSLRPEGARRVRLLGVTNSEIPDDAPSGNESVR
ncbi:MAG: ArsR/SmtB family transcription factor [Cellulomonadaceae bacterium]